MPRWQESRTETTVCSFEDGLTVIAVLEPFRVAVLDALHAVKSIKAHGLAPKMHVTVLPIWVPPVPLLLTNRRTYYFLTVVPLAVREVDSLPVDSHLANGLSACAAFMMRLATPVSSPVPTTVRPAAHEHHVPHCCRSFPGSEDEFL